MTIISFMFQLVGATMLLLYAVRMVRTGIERAFGSSFRRIMTTTGRPLNAAATGVMMAIVLQSSAAVALLVSGFTGTGAISFASGLSIVLGADLGSALLIQVLSFKLDWLVPVLLAVGGTMFIKTERSTFKQAGRIILGIAFILISLRFLRETMDPIRESAFLPAIAGYLESDYLSAFIIGATLAWFMHSSVAVILMCVTLIGVEAIPLAAGVSLVLGANLGSALIPVWLSRGFSPAARRVPVANCLLRGTGAFVALILGNTLPIISYLSFGSDAQTLILLHVTFNALLLFLLPLGRVLDQPMQNLLPDLDTDLAEERQEDISVLDDSALAMPQLALANLKREVLRMEQVVESMTTPAMDLFGSYDKQRASNLIARDQVLNDALDGVRRYVAAIPTDGMSGLDKKRARELTEYAIALETVGDLVVKSLISLAKEKSQKGIRFSKAGRSELVNIHEHVISNMGLASNVLVSDDLESARLLLEEKTEVARMERSSRKKHLRRLSEGSQTSFDSSDLHLEVLRTLREVNSHIASVSYPILYRAGHLLETRLIETLEDEGRSEAAE